MPVSRYRVRDDDYPHLVTCCVCGHLPAFTRPWAAAQLFESLAWLREHRGVRLLGYVVMENHLHLIVRSPALARDVGSFKSFTARRILDRLWELGDGTLVRQLRSAKDRWKADRPQQFWRDDNHPKLISGEAMLRQKLAYVHDNPVRRGYVADPTHRMYSSARNYAGLSAYAEVDRQW